MRRDYIADRRQYLSDGRRDPASGGWAVMSWDARREIYVEPTHFHATREQAREALRERLEDKLARPRQRLRGMTNWKATHEIRDGSRHFRVMVMDSDHADGLVMYTRDEWDAGINADWTFGTEDGLRCQGQIVDGASFHRLA